MFGYVDRLPACLLTELQTRGVSGWELVHRPDRQCSLTVDLRYQNPRKCGRRFRPFFAERNGVVK